MLERVEIKAKLIAIEANIAQCRQFLGLVMELSTLDDIKSNLLGFSQEVDSMINVEGMKLSNRVSKELELLKDKKITDIVVEVYDWIDNAIAGYLEDKIST